MNNDYEIDVFCNAPMVIDCHKRTTGEFGFCMAGEDCQHQQKVARYTK